VIEFEGAYNGIRVECCNCGRLIEYRAASHCKRV
jgi:hypothetical protein